MKPRLILLDEFRLAKAREEVWNLQEPTAQVRVVGLV